MHVALTHEHRFARCFCRGSGNTARWYFLHDNQKENTIPYGNLVFSFFAYTNRKVLSSFYKAAYAQDMLEEAGIASTLKKLPTELVRSCSTGLYLRTDDIQRVKAVLSGKQIAPGGIYLIRRSADGQKGYGKVR